MRKSKIILTILIPALIISFALTTEALAGKRFETITTGSMEEGDAVIELTPEMKGDKLVVRFAANTHSIDLSQFDMGKASVLQFNGKELAPSKSDNFRGHHAFGKMVFNVGQELTSFKIILKGIPALPERVYEWGEN